MQFSRWFGWKAIVFVSIYIKHITVKILESNARQFLVLAVVVVVLYLFLGAFVLFLLD